MSLQEKMKHSLAGFIEKRRSFGEAIFDAFHERVTFWHFWIDVHQNIFVGVVRESRLRVRLAQWEQKKNNSQKHPICSYSLPVYDATLIIFGAAR